MTVDFCCFLSYVCFGDLKLKCKVCGTRDYVLAEVEEEVQKGGNNDGQILTFL